MVTLLCQILRFCSHSTPSSVDQASKKALQCAFIRAAVRKLGRTLHFISQPVLLFIASAYHLQHSSRFLFAPVQISNVRQKVGDWRDSAETKPRFEQGQGDQIGRIFAQWTIVLTLGSLKNDISCPKCGASLLQYSLCILTKKWIGLHFGRFFSKTHLVTLSNSDQLLCD
jgi:hypothetical protein